VLILIVLLAIFLRVYGINWDGGTHAHPDERFLTMVVNDMVVPNSFLNYLNPDSSMFNPYNLNKDFFTYGTFPTTIIKLVVSAVNMDTYALIPIAGRLISVMADIGTLLFVYFFAKKWEKDYGLQAYIKYFAALLYAVAVLPIQQSHFFTVDAVLVFFLHGIFVFYFGNIVFQDMQ